MRANKAALDQKKAWDLERQRRGRGRCTLGWRIPFPGSRNPPESTRIRPSTKSVRIPKRQPRLYTTSALPLRLNFRCLSLRPLKLSQLNMTGASNHLAT